MSGNYHLGVKGSQRGEQRAHHCLHLPMFCSPLASLPPAAVNARLTRPYAGKRLLKAGCVVSAGSTQNARQD